MDICLSIHIFMPYLPGFRWIFAVFYEKNGFVSKIGFRSTIIY